MYIFICRFLLNEEPKNLNITRYLLGDISNWKTDFVCSCGFFRRLADFPKCWCYFSMRCNWFGAAWKHDEASMNCLFRLRRLGWWNYACSYLSIFHMFEGVLLTLLAAPLFFSLPVMSTHPSSTTFYTCLHYIYIYICSPPPHDPPQWWSIIVTKCMGTSPDHFFMSNKLN